MVSGATYCITGDLSNLDNLELNAEFSKVGLFIRFDEGEEEQVCEYSRKQFETSPVSNIKPVKIPDGFTGQFNSWLFLTPSGRSFGLTVKILE